MRLNPSNSIYLFALCFALIGTTEAIAQDGHFDMDAISSEPVRNEPDPVLNSETDTRSNTKTISTLSVAKESQRDSLQIKSARPIKSSEAAQQEGDPLSFNFLYYIIEKFKLSDVIE